MDTGMRDLAHIQEREAEGPSRKVATVMMAALATVGLVFAMGILLGREDSAVAEAPEDPLAALDRAAGIETEETPIEDEPPPEVEREELSFPEALGGYDERPEVEAALAAAAAELAHPDPDVAAADLATGRPSLPPPIDAMHSALPAAVAAGPSAQILARSVAHDPMVAAALPREPARAAAPAGRDGEYTLQVVSYQNPTDANVFAQGLRDKGHEAFVVTADIPDRGRWWRVRIGPFENMREAESYRASFEATEHMNTYVVRRRQEG